MSWVFYFTIRDKLVFGILKIIDRWINFCTVFLFDIPAFHREMIVLCPFLFFPF